MENKKTINGVDVSKCKFFLNKISTSSNICSDYQPENNGFSFCKQHKDCYYKQLQKALQENEAYKLESQEGAEIFAELKHENKELRKQNKELKLQLNNYKNNPEMQKAITYFQTGEYDIQISILEKENKKLKEALKSIEDNIMNIMQSNLSDYTKECLKSVLRHIEECERK